MRYSDLRKIFQFFLLILLTHNPFAAVAGCGNGYKNTSLNMEFNPCNAQLSIKDLKIYEYNLGKDDFIEYAGIYLYRNKSWELLWKVSKDTAFESFTEHQREEGKFYYGNLNSGNFKVKITGRDVDSWWVFFNLETQGIPQDVAETGEVKLRLFAQMYNSCKNMPHEALDTVCVFKLPQINEPANIRFVKKPCNNLELKWDKPSIDIQKSFTCNDDENFFTELSNKGVVLESFSYHIQNWMDTSYNGADEYSYQIRSFYQFYEGGSKIYSKWSKALTFEKQQKTTEEFSYQKKKFDVKNSNLDSLLKINQKLQKKLAEYENILHHQKVINPTIENNDKHYKNDSKDSLLLIIENLKNTLDRKDSLIAEITKQGNSSLELNEEDNEIKTLPGDYIVVGVYNSLRQAKYNQVKHGYVDFEIVKSKSGKWYYIAAPLRENTQVFSALKNIRRSVTKNAWWLKIEQ